ncbi:NERD domain-containing protein [Virgibacillus sp. MSP4-1]|uniref:nuclease-related domain-containing protein n=1 Tax=Virgibacillus sp. MSP4-1 TaxID=2700081 RepID=UPI0003AB046E|nr:nuclease-related domain-containing protein [Virgibacillus sp. MSP4-1]QHS23543.1 NERD domain-containing protein [Virgibacillus sp. MSP4-1]
MIVKQREMPLIIPQLQALDYRLPEQHLKRPIIRGELSKQIIGYQGEKSVDYQLSHLPLNKYYILHNLRLPDNKSFFQIDTLLLSYYYILNMEIKNFGGSIYFDDHFGQVIQTQNGKEKALPDPIYQINRQELQLEKWLRRHNFPFVPIESIVVFGNANTTIKAEPGSPAFEKVMHSAKILKKLEEFDQKYKYASLKRNQVQSISDTLIKEHTPKRQDILRKYSISESEVIKGTRCPRCSAVPIQRQKRKWICHKCGFSSKKAHLDSLQDYALLFSPTITNQQFREFFSIPSPSTASKMLANSEFKKNGHTKGTKYTIPLNF